MGKAIDTSRDNLGYFNPPNVYRPAIIDIRLVGEYSAEDGATNTYRITQNDGKVFEFGVKNGSGGSAGRSVTSVEQIQISTESLGKNVARITLSDGTYTDVEIRNGAQGEVGPQGERGPAGIDSVEAAIGTNDPTQAPSVDKDLTEGVLSLTFNNIKGEKGDKGDQGNTGSSVDYPYELVNNVTTDDATKGLSAAQGVVLDGKISQLGQYESELPEVVEYINRTGSIASGQSRVILSITSLAGDTDGYVALNGFDGRIDFCNSSYRPIATYKCLDGEPTQVKFPKECPMLVVNTLSGAAVSSETPFTIVAKYGTIANYVSRQLATIDNFIGNEIKVFATQYDSRVQSNIINGAFRISVKDGYAIHAINEVNADGSTIKTIALADFTRKSFDNPSAGLYRIFFAKTNNGNISITDDIIDSFTGGDNYRREQVADIPSIKLGLNGLLIQGKSFPYAESLDLSNLVLQHAYVDANNGTISINAKRYVSDYVPIAPSSEIKLGISKTDNDYTCIYAFFYHIHADGSVQYIGYKNTSNLIIGIDTFVPSSANAVRFQFMKYVGGVEQEVVKSELVSPAFAVSISNPTYFTDKESEIYSVKTLKEALFVKELWLQGTGATNANVQPNCCTYIPLIEVTPGHTYEFLWHPIYPIDLIWTMRLEMMSDKDTILSTTSQIYRNNPLFTIPSGVKYVRIRLEGAYNNKALTPEDCADAELHIYDVTFDRLKLPNCSRVINLPYSSSRYAQGMAICNGFIFQAYSNGEVEIYDVVTNSLLDTIQLPTATGEINPPHCNSMQFSDEFISDAEFPILWVSNNLSPNGNMMGLQITRNGNEFAVEKVYECQSPALDESVYTECTQYFDFKNKKCVQVSYEKTTEYPGYFYGFYKTFIQVFSYDNLNDNTTFTEDYHITYPRLFPTQGGCIQSRMLYLVGGAGNVSKSIYCFDLDKKMIDGIVNLGDSIINIGNSEPQAYCGYQGVRYLSTTDGIYKFTL